MNQTQNRVQHKNLTEDEAKDFDFENYKYQYQAGSGIWQPYTCHGDEERRFSPAGQCVYRLVIEPDKFYFWQEGNYSGIGKGEDISEQCQQLRPARPDEIPKAAVNPVGLLCYVDHCIYEILEDGAYTQEPKPLSITELEEYLQRAKAAGVDV